MTVDVDTLLKKSDDVLMAVMPELRDAARLVIEDLAAIGLGFGAFMGYRSLEQQTALYAQGRESLALVNALRAKASMAAIDDYENRLTVTTLKVGFHNLGLAVDLVEDGDPDKAGIQWSWAKNADYLAIGKIAQQRGLEWGGFWKSFKDYPHVQLTGGISIGEALDLERVSGRDALWAEVRTRLGAGKTGA